MFQFLALTGSYTPHAARWGWSTILQKECLQLTGTKSLRYTYSKTTFSPCSLSVENIELIRSGLTQTSNYSCCTYPVAKVGIAQNKDLALYWLKEGAGGVSKSCWFGITSATHYLWTQRGWSRPILPEKSPRSSNKLLNFMLVFFLKDLAPGDIRLSKNESFHLKEVSF